MGFLWKDEILVNKGCKWRTCVFPFIPTTWVTDVFLKVERAESAQYSSQISLMREDYGHDGRIALKLQTSPSLPKVWRKETGLFEPVFFIYSCKSTKIPASKTNWVDVSAGHRALKKTSLLIAQELEREPLSFSSSDKDLSRVYRQSDYVRFLLPIQFHFYFHCSLITLKSKRWTW